MLDLAQGRTGMSGPPVVSVAAARTLRHREVRRADRAIRNRSAGSVSARYDRQGTGSQRACHDVAPLDQDTHEPGVTVHPGKEGIDLCDQLR